MIQSHYVQLHVCSRAEEVSETSPAVSQLFNVATSESQESLRVLLYSCIKQAPLLHRAAMSVHLLKQLANEAKPCSDPEQGTNNPRVTGSSLTFAIGEDIAVWYLSPRKQVADEEETGC